MTELAREARIRIESVRIFGRHRYAIGDVTDLAESIASIGLIHPVTLTPDMRLISGQRRIEAHRQLGHDTIPARIVDNLDDAAKMLRAELDENTCRKEMLPSELASLGEALCEVAAQEAKDRQQAHTATRDERGRIASSSSQGGTGDRDRGKETAAVVGKALGIGRTTYIELRHVYEAATDPDSPEPERALARDALDKIDRGAGIQSTARNFRQQQRAKRDAQEAKAAALGDQPSATPVPSATERDDTDWVPPANDSSRKASTQRRTLIRTLAGQGWSSQQIGKHLGVLDVTVRRIARDEGITIRADEALGGRQRKIDSNRIVRETVATLDGLAMGLQLIAYDDLDPTEIENWATSLGDSIRLLTGLKKQLSNRMKEMTL